MFCIENEVCNTLISFIGTDKRILLPHGLWGNCAWCTLMILQCTKYNAIDMYNLYKLKHAYSELYKIQHFSSV